MKRVRNLLIFRLGSIGDTVVALPCFHAIARAFPEHRRILLTNPPNCATASSVEAVLTGSSLIDYSLYFPIGPGRWRQFAALARALRKLQPEPLVYLAERSNALQVYRDLLFFRTAGIGRIIGATRDVKCRLDPRTGELEYEAERLLRSLGEAIPADLTPPNWDLKLTEVEQKTAAEKLSGLLARRPLLAVAPGAKIAEKDWGEVRWAALLEMLRQRVPAASLIFIGAPVERPRTQRLAALWPGLKVNLCGELTPRESAAVLGRCDLLLCHDSGPMHLAAAQGTRCVALFGNYNRPHSWFPYGPDHVVLHSAGGVTNVGIERVAHCVEAALCQPQPATRHRGALVRLDDCEATDL